MVDTDTLPAWPPLNAARPRPMPATWSRLLLCEWDHCGRNATWRIDHVCDATEPSIVCTFHLGATVDTLVRQCVSYHEARALACTPL